MTAEAIYEELGGDLCVCQRVDLPTWCEKCQQRIALLDGVLRAARIPIAALESTRRHLSAELDSGFTLPQARHIVQHVIEHVIDPAMVPGFDGWLPIEHAPKEPDADGITPLLILGFAPTPSKRSATSCEGYWSVPLQCWLSLMFVRVDPSHFQYLPPAPAEIADRETGWTGQPDYSGTLLSIEQATAEIFRRVKP